MAAAGLKYVQMVNGEGMELHGMDAVPEDDPLSQLNLEEVLDSLLASQPPPPRAPPPSALSLSLPSSLPAPQGERPAERLCWGSVLMGSSERCTPSFEIGKGHFKNKFCPNCRGAGVPLPAARVRALSSSQHAEWTNDMHLGLWSENRIDGQVVHYRLVNQTHKCYGPWIVILRVPPPPGMLWAQMPPQWVRDGWCTLLVSKGTLVPSEPRERSQWLAPDEVSSSGIGPVTIAESQAGPIEQGRPAQVQLSKRSRPRAGAADYATSENDSETSSQAGGTVAKGFDDVLGPLNGTTPKEIATLRYLHERLATMVIDQFQRPERELVNMGIDEAQLGAFVALLQPVRASAELLRRDVAAASATSTPRMSPRAIDTDMPVESLGVGKPSSHHDLDAADLFASLQEESTGSHGEFGAQLPYYDARIGEFSPSSTEMAQVRAKLGLMLSSIVSTGELMASNRAMEDRDLCLLQAELRRVATQAATDGCGVDVGAAGARASAVPALPPLTRLDLSSNFLTEDGVRCLTQMLDASFGHLQLLDLSTNRIADPGLEALAYGLLRSGCLKTLIHLRLNFCRVSCMGLRPLAAAFASAGIPALETLDLNANSIGDDGCVALAGTLLSQPEPPPLRTLALGAPWGGNAISDKGAIALAHALGAGRLPYLRSFAIANNRIGEDGAMALAKPIAAGKLPELELLSVVANHIPINALRVVRAAAKAMNATAISEPQIGLPNTMLGM